MTHNITSKRTFFKILKKNNLHSNFKYLNIGKLKKITNISYFKFPLTFSILYYTLYYLYKNIKVAYFERVVVKIEYNKYKMKLITKSIWVSKYDKQFALHLFIK